MKKRSLMLLILCYLCYLPSISQQNDWDFDEPNIGDKTRFLVERFFPKQPQITDLYVNNGPKYYYKYKVNDSLHYSSILSISGDIYHNKNKRKKNDTVFFIKMSPNIEHKTDSFFRDKGLNSAFLLYYNPSLSSSVPQKEEIMIAIYRGLKRQVVVNDRLITDTIPLDTLKKQQSIYARSLHHNISDIFCLKLDKSKPDYFRGTYAVLPKVYDALFTLKEIDTLTYGRDYPLFHYQVGQRYLYEDGKYKTVGYWKAPMDSNFLQLVFCPQIGIMSYYFVKANIKIALENIDNKPIRYYVENHICLTHLCEIK